jgi:uncharacterized phage protein (TIGR01671 family)
MNREIKFRAWDKSMKKMKHPKIWDNTMPSNWDEHYELQQYTGLTDNNGKKIFEGDILSVGENLTCEIIYIDKNSQDWGDEIHASFHAKIYRHNKKVPIDSYFLNNCKVIGNIFETPQLINK